jgi:hypothetical protein
MAENTYPEIRIAYPRAWEDDYRRTCTVAAWKEYLPDFLCDEKLSKNPGTLDLFPQYALFPLLAKSEGVRSTTWLKVANIDPKARALVKPGQPWVPPPVNPTAEHADWFRSNWQVMREYMGADFDTLQEAIVRAGFDGFEGEPDLFCFSPKSRRWFFAEAKGRDQLGEKQTNVSGSGWFDIALKTLGERGRVRVYRVVAE